MSDQSIKNGYQIMFQRNVIKISNQQFCGKLCLIRTKQKFTFLLYFGKFQYLFYKTFITSNYIKVI